MPSARPAVAIHGGAGRLDRRRVSAHRDAELRAALGQRLSEATEALARRASALEVVQATVAALEDDPLFNAGRGSALTSEGSVEMDAALMDGALRTAGAVACVRGVRHPIALARRVLEEGRSVLLVGEGAERFADEVGLERVDPVWLITEERRAELASARAQGRLSLDRDESGALGTVGAVARDLGGHLAAATSTGGMTNQRPGRVGDSPILGAGTWADDASCAVSASGHGELFVRAAFAHEVDAGMRLAGLPLGVAALRALARVAALGGAGGCVAVAGAGDPIAAFNTPGMVRGWAVAGGAPSIFLYGDEG